MNVELLNQVVAYLEEVPTRFNMNSWYEHVDPNEGPSRQQQNNYGINRAPACGTVACIAGTVNILTGAAPVEDVIGGIKFYGDPEGGHFASAEKLLELTREQAQRLFYHNESMYFAPDRRWPEQFDKAYASATNATERVKVLKARVAHFIATDGRE